MAPTTETPSDAGEENGAAKVTNKEQKGSARKKKYNNKYQGRDRKSINSFKGNEEKMNGHLFQTFNECQDATQFQKTLKALKEYTNKALKYASDIRPLFKMLT